MSDSTYNISPADRQKISDWVRDTCNPAAIEAQRSRHIATGTEPSAFQVSCWENGQPYGGAIGGSLEYCFTPTSLGMVFIIKDCISGLELNLTDYDSW